MHIVNDLNAIIKKAAEKGIKIIPVSASGVNKDTEFLFRFFAVATNGTYVFITNNSGIGGDHIEATVGDYEVELLNDLMVRRDQQVHQIEYARDNFLADLADLAEIVIATDPGFKFFNDGSNKICDPLCDLKIVRRA